MKFVFPHRRDIRNMPSITLSNANRSMPSILAHMSPSSLANLQQEISTVIHPQTMFWYSINFSIFLFSLWAVALCLHDFVLPSRFILGQRWKKCDGNRRTMIVYLLSIVSCDAADCPMHC